ncbi:MAG: hypothetical protein ACT4O0_03795 [Pseudonocardia sp.]
MKFTLWGLMVNPGMTPAPVSSVHRQQMVDRYLHPVPPPAMKKRACLFGWVAVAVAAVAITLLVLGHIVLFLAGSAVGDRRVRRRDRRDTDLPVGVREVVAEAEFADPLTVHGPVLADVSMMSLVNKSEKVTISARDVDGVSLGTFTETVKLRELQIAFPSADRGQIVAALEDNAELEMVVQALSALLRDRKQPLSLL